MLSTDKINTINFNAQNNNEQQANHQNYQKYIHAT